MKKIINCIALLLFLPSLTAQKNRAFEVKQVMERVADVHSVSIPAGHFTIIEEADATNTEIEQFANRVSG